MFFFNKFIVFQGILCLIIGCFLYCSKAIVEENRIYCVIETHYNQFYGNPYEEDTCAPLNFRDFHLGQTTLEETQKIMQSQPYIYYNVHHHSGYWGNTNGCFFFKEIPGTFEINYDKEERIATIWGYTYILGQESLMVLGFFDSILFKMDIYNPNHHITDILDAKLGNHQIIQHPNNTTCFYWCSCTDIFDASIILSVDAKVQSIQQLNNPNINYHLVFRDIIILQKFLEYIGGL